MKKDSDFNLCYIGVGSNLGDRLGNIKKARDLLKNTTGIRFRRMSPVYQTDAVGIPNAEDFFNCVFEIETSETPGKLLKICKEIEREMGRNTDLVMDSRVIDLDILTYGNLTFNSHDLIIPHSRMHERLFVIEPLSDLSPDFIHPVFKVKISELRRKLEGSNRMGILNLVP